MTRIIALLLLLSACDPLNGQGRNTDGDGDIDTVGDLDTSEDSRVPTGMQTQTPTLFPMGIQTPTPTRY
ncbi:MAG: hypothetical protein ACJARS_001697, partial [bacterium]